MQQQKALVRGISYHMRRIGQSAKMPTLVMFHGFLGSGDRFLPVIKGIKPGVNILLPDLIGFGKSDAPADPERYSPENQVDDWIEILEKNVKGPIILLGYSMGGRLAIRLALRMAMYATDPGNRLAGLILESCTPGIRDHDERMNRKKTDEALATRLLTDFEAFLEFWESQPLFATGSSKPVKWHQHGLASPAGAAASLRGFGSGVAEPVWDRLGGIDVPVMLISGELDARFRSIALEMAAGLSNATNLVIPGASHRVHSDNPDAYICAINNWLEKLALT